MYTFSYKFERGYPGCSLRTLRRVLTFLLLMMGMANVTASKCHAQGLTLILGGSSLTFSNANPATTSSIAAAENPVSLKVVYVGLGHWTLSVQANGDLVAGAATIPISNVTWTATGSAFVSGTMSKTSAQPVSSGALILSIATGTLSFYLNNSWGYTTGAYAQTFTFTLSSF